ncbi:hypothetical protein QNH46_09980 [Paenibacillus woosongensis]|uniref:Uncharacterized protein n=1 Tax=Paenibacillus woosongensis TaxID=307580 RepID=A0AA95I5H7_9BACL|nr:hypothetical protein [Paenibacillus woosongensis]WHX50939.1 hypothetical protein QNH46_09980 [Paenibacillus woosongensis]
MVAGCTGKHNPAEQSLENGSPTNQYASQEAPGEVGEAEAKHTPDPDTRASDAAKLSVVVGGEVKLETSLEHETATFDGTEYTIEPFGVTFAVRTDMGEPVVEGDSIVFVRDLSGKATISYEVMENTSLYEAVAREQQDHDGSFSGEFIETTSKGGLRGKHNQYKEDSVFSGVFFYEFDRHVLRIEYQCPIAAVDAMIRIVNETVDSVRWEDNN